jgi:hypothetical protein
MALRGEGPSRAGQVRTVCTLSYVGCEVTVNLCCGLAWEKLYTLSEELGLGLVQRKCRLKNFNKSLYVSGLCR